MKNMKIEINKSQTFDDWLEESDVDSYSNPYYSARAAFEAGQQSKQAEIDELKATIVKYEAGLRKNKANKHKLLSKNIELQKRIDNLKSKAEWHIEDCECSHPMSKYQSGWFEAMSLVLETLKGKQDD